MSEGMKLAIMGGVLLSVWIAQQIGVEIGKKHARKVLSEMDPEVLRKVFEK